MATLDRPVAVNFHIWPKCNLKCKFCYATFPHVRRTLPLAEALAVIDSLAVAGTTKITFVGGGKRTNPRVRQSRNDRSGDYFPKTRAKSDGATNPEQARLPSGSRACSCFTVPRLSRPLGPVGRPR